MNPIGSDVDRCFVIAEVGVNHNGDIALAERLIEAAVEAGADAVKFQIWVPGEQSGAFAEKPGYLDRSTPNEKSFVDILEDVRLSFDQMLQLKRRADSLNIIILATPDGPRSLDFVVDELCAPFVKVGSTEVTYSQYLSVIGAKGRPVLLSTGMSNLQEVKKAIAALRAGGAKSIVLLHCTSQYPALAEEMNLRAMKTLRDAFDLPVGLSDHSIGIEASIAAVAMGAKVIEKHLTLSQNMVGSDHKTSLEPNEFRELVRSIRSVEMMLGTGVKQPSPGEMKDMMAIRRSVVAACDIAPGTRFDADLLTCQRPGTGIPPDQIGMAIGKLAKRALRKGEPIRWEDIGD